MTAESARWQAGDTPLPAVLRWARRHFGAQTPITPTAPNPGAIRLGDPTSTVDPDTGWVTGWVFTEGPDDDTVTYGGSGPTQKGSVIIYEDASFLYKPSLTARRAAAASGGDQDSFTITVDDPRSGRRAIPVTVDVLPDRVI